ncbi:3034_t:CDS:2, partial [Racocetra persica]
ERKWIDWCKKWTVPNTKTTKGLPWDNHLWKNVVSNAKISPSAYAVAVGTWWSLSEGILNEPYSKFDAKLVPKVLEAVGKMEYLAWSHTTAVEVAMAAENIYKGKTYWIVIKETMNLARFNSGSNVYKTLLKCFPNDKSVPATGLSMNCANLVKIWLVRNHLVGLSVAVSDNLSCLNSSSNYPSWCMNNKKFSNGFEGVKNTINILANYYAN